MTNSDRAPVTSVMTGPAEDGPPRYARLTDYLRVVRQYWKLIAALVVVAAVVAYVVSERQQPVYQSTATLSYVDDTYALALLGSAEAPVEIPASQGLPAEALKVSSPSVVAAVARALHGRVPAAYLPGTVSASIDAKTGLIDITVSAHDPQLAAQIANLFAAKTAAATNRGSRERYAGAVHVLSGELAHVVGTGPDASGTRASIIDQMSRLSFLSANASPAQVVTAAQPAGAPVSPRTSRNTALAALAGLLIGLIAAFLRDSLDSRMRGSREIQRVLDIDVVGRVRDQAMGTVFQFAGGHRGGAYDPAPDVEAIRIMRQNLDRLGGGAPPRSLVVTSAVPGEGKSTVAASLAVAVACAGRRTLLVECDLRRPTLAKRLGLSSAPGLSEYLAGTAEPQDVLRQVPLPMAMPSINGRNGSEPHPSRASLVCVVAGTPPAMPAELLESERCRAFLRDVHAVYDTVIIDTSPLLVVADTLTLLSQVDGAVLCVRSSHTTREQAQAAKEALAHYPGLVTGLAVTGLHARDEDGSYSYAFAEA